MSHFFSGIVFCVVLSSCRPVYNAARPYEVYPKRPEFFQTILNNDVDAPQDKPATEIILEDQSYPIAIKLYKSGKFHYQLRKLGDGDGTWNFDQGALKLYAERKLFVMNFELQSIDPVEQDALALEFSDRFGPKYLRLKHQSN